MITKLEVYTCLFNILGENLDKRLTINNDYFLSAVSWIDETKNLNYHEKCKITVELFDANFKKYFEEVIIVTSLNIDYKKLKKCTLEYNLSSKGLIIPFSEKIFFDNEYENDTVFSEINLGFRIFKDIVHQDILDLSFLIMGSEILPIDSGYLFFIMPYQNVVIYPHSDIGYGAFKIDLNKDAKAWESFETDKNIQDLYNIIN